MFLKLFIIILFSFMISQKIIAFSITLLKSAGCTSKNYRGIDVVFGMGIIYIPIILISLTLAIILYLPRSLNYTPYLFIVCAIGFAGLLDDLIGIKQVKGLKNHIKSFINGHLTTGFIKAFIGIIASIIISLEISHNLIELILNSFNIALFTNTLNLMDLRPGRCIKVFLLFGFIILAISISEILAFLPLLIILISSAIYMKYDLKEVCILGDTGSNILGITLGYFSSLSFYGNNKIIIFIALFIINALAEKFSITRIISNNRILSFLDNLGRSSG